MTELSEAVTQSGQSARNLILCFDGTNNQFGTINTSIVRLVQVMNREPTQQLVFYDPGVGTLPEPGYVSAFGKWLSKIAGLAFGAGLFEKISDSYIFLMEHWRPGDRVFLFGFSRGSYTARALAAALHMFGLLPSGSAHLVPYLLRLFKASRGELRQSPEKQHSYWSLCDQFRETFSRAIPDCPDRRFPIHFMGVFDTVSSVGWVWDPLSLPFTSKNPNIAIVRHAVSIDERRCFFRQNVLASAPGQDFQELWFAGVHSDVGGGYPEADGGLWREPYAWMLEAAKAAHFSVDPDRESAVWTRSNPPQTASMERQHESLHGAWWLAEFFPKLSYSVTTQKRRPHLGLGRRRRIPDGALLHPSVLARIRNLDPPYSPGNLPASLLREIRSGSTTEGKVELDAVDQGGESHESH